MLVIERNDQLDDIASNKSRDFWKKLFLQTRDFCKAQEEEGKLAEKEIIEAFDEKKENVIHLQYIKNTNQLLETQDHDHGFWDYEYENIGFLDTTFLNNFKKFIILEIEEYTFYIIEFLLKKFPEKEIVSLDRLSLSIWDEKAVAFSRESRELELQNTCFVYSREEQGSPTTVVEGNCRCSSYHLMYSLFWMSKMEHLGELHKDKIIFLIEYSTGTHGLVDIIRCTCALILYARRRNWFPVVHLNRFPNQYLASAGDNMWEYFFEPSSKLSYEDALNGSNVVRTLANGFHLIDFFCTPFLASLDYEVYSLFYYYDVSVVKSVLRINFESMKEIHALLPRQFLNSKVLGVVCRGTDYLCREDNADADTMIRASEHHCEEYGCKYVFLATEDKTCLSKFKNFFGKRLLYIHQKRVSYDAAANKSNLPVAKLLDIKNGVQFGRTYLAVLYALGRCNVLISSMSCGAFIGAKLLADRYFEKIEIISTTKQKQSTG